MAIKKSELYSSLWKSCDELRGGMDASQYKDYVLILLFVKYVSDKYAGDPTALIDVPAGGSFADMVAAKGDKEIGDKINIIIARLAVANESLQGAINVADFNDEEKLGKGKEMVDRLTKLVAIFEGLDFGSNRAEGDDLLGDAYEYLMRHFATESGKSKGQFYTPSEVSRTMALVLDLGKANSAGQSIYDPTCGSGSLLLKAHDEAKHRTGLDLALYGQEMDNATSALARMNMVLHDCPTAEIWQANTLSAPHFKNSDGRLKTFDFIVANPPFSTKAWTSGLDPANDLYERFEYGTPPEKNGDYAFLLHMLKSLKSTGKAAVILPHGVLFRGGAEGGIRKRILQQGFIKGIIGLPANLFYGTGIPACIIVMDKDGAAGRKGIFMVDASKGFIKDGNKNRLRAQDIHKIVDVFTKQLETPKYARMVPLAEIEANDFNLNLPRYIDSTEPEDLQDIAGHLRGGIPTRDIDSLKSYWDVFPGVRKALFMEAEPPKGSPVDGMSAEYFDVHFEHLADWSDCPKQFCTVTGYATTGETWSDEKNQAADLALEAELRSRKIWMRRLTGFSPITGHREPGWAVALDLTQACDLGMKYKQDAIYHVNGDALSVSFCDARRALVPVGAFQPRLHLVGSGYVVRPGYCQPTVPASEVKAVIFGHPEFTAFNTRVTQLFATWTAANTPLLTGIQQGQRPNALIETLSESLLDTFRSDAAIASLIDPYGVYQHLMDYWAAVMQDDAWMIVSDGWQGVQSGKPNTDLIPPDLVVARYFATEQKAIEQLETERDAITRQIEELDEEHGGEEGLLADAKNDKGKLTKVSAKAQLAKIKHDKTAADERKLLETHVDLTEQEASAAKKVKDAAKVLDAKVAAIYGQISIADVNLMVVVDKWLAALEVSVQGELDRVSQALTGRIKQLAERYATPVPQLAAEVETLAARVDEHLKKMGFVWN